LKICAVLKSWSVRDHTGVGLFLCCGKRWRIRREWESCICLCARETMRVFHHRHGHSRVVARIAVWSIALLVQVVQVIYAVGTQPVRHTSTTSYIIESLCKE